MRCAGVACCTDCGNVLSPLGRADVCGLLASILAMPNVSPCSVSGPGFMCTPPSTQGVNYGIQNGAHLSRAKVRFFKHNDLQVGREGAHPLPSVMAYLACNWERGWPAWHASNWKCCSCAPCPQAWGLVMLMQLGLVCSHGHPQNSSSLPVWL